MITAPRLPSSRRRERRNSRTGTLYRLVHAAADGHPVDDGLPQRVIVGIEFDRRAEDAVTEYAAVIDGRGGRVRKDEVDDTSEDAAYSEHVHQEDEETVSERSAARAPLHRLSLFAIRPADDQVIEVLKSLQLLEVGTRERHAEISSTSTTTVHQIEAVEVERFGAAAQSGVMTSLLHFEFVGQNGIDFSDEFLLCHCLRGIYLHFFG